MTNWQKHVLPHGPLVEIGAGLWQVTGSLRRNPLPRNMVIWRTPQKKLLIHSAICLQEAAMHELDALGEVAYIIVPCVMHCADVGPYKERYSSAKILCPRCARSKVEEIVPVTHTLEEVLPGLGVVLHRPKGLKDFEIHLELPLADGSRALLVTDALFNLGSNPPKGFGGFMLKLLGSVGPLNITKIGKRMLLENKADYADYVLGLSQIDNLRVLSVAHGSYIDENLEQALRSASERIRA